MLSCLSGFVPTLCSLSLKFSFPILYPDSPQSAPTSPPWPASQDTICLEVSLSVPHSPKSSLSLYFRFETS